MLGSRPLTVDVRVRDALRPADVLQKDPQKSIRPLKIDTHRKHIRTLVATWLRCPEVIHRTTQPKLSKPSSDRVLELGGDFELAFVDEVLDQGLVAEIERPDPLALGQRPARSIAGRAAVGLQEEPCVAHGAEMS